VGVKEFASFIGSKLETQRWDSLGSAAQEIKDVMRTKSRQKNPERIKSYKFQVERAG
jgi:hypothetical protein